MPRVSAAVLNYNGRRLLEVILPSLTAQRYRDFEILVVDDCSNDDSLEYLQREWPVVRVLSTGDSNVGVSAALNVAVRASSGEFVALLNNDIELDPLWLGELVAALDRHPEAATVDKPIAGSTITRRRSSHQLRARAFTGPRRLPT
jgi:GT2 family glycosyltransferase